MLNRDGSRTSSDIIDEMNESVDSMSISELSHCKNINHTELLEIFNILLQLSPKSKKEKVMYHIISNYGSKYKLVFNEDPEHEYSFEEQRKMSKLVMMRIQKYDLCKIMDEMEYHDLFVGLINLKTMVI